MRTAFLCVLERLVGAPSWQWRDLGCSILGRAGKVGPPFQAASGVDRVSFVALHFQFAMGGYGAGCSWLLDRLFTYDTPFFEVLVEFSLFFLRTLGLSC